MACYGEASAEFSFNIEIERTLRVRLRQARLARLESDKEQPVIHSDSEPEREVKTMGENPPPPERLLGDYGMTNAPGGRLSIVNQPVNVPNFQLHPNIINQLERKPFSGKINEDANKHLQRILTMSTTLKIEGHTEEAKKLCSLLPHLKMKNNGFTHYLLGVLPHGNKWKPLF